jgi:NAD-dependent SIR2 family protein deacetylase
MHIIDNARQSLQAYAWPGGYPIIYVAIDGWREEDGTLTVFGKFEHSCCTKCAADTAQWPDMIIVGQNIHYEGEPEQCEYCNGFTDSAYGDPAKEKKSTH